MGESNQFIKVWQKVLKPFLISLSHLTYINSRAQMDFINK